jgi:hypothetical protein
MKTYFAAAASGILAGALFLCTAPAMAQGGLAVSIGIPAPVIVAPLPYFGPAVVYGGYGPVVQFGGPYYYGRGWDGYGNRRGYRRGHEGHRGSRR